MRDPDQFDQFYKDVRSRLLLLTYCLTGDLPSSRAAVRDAFVTTWHHWRKVSRYEDPESWTRVRACTYAQRRHTAKLWHREKGLDPEVKATLDALGKLPVTQRRVLLLTQLTTASLAEVSHEARLTRTETERALQTATSQLALLRDVPTPSIRQLFEPVREHLESSTWSRAPIIRRAGATRQRTHTVVGVAATVAALVLAGALVTDGTGVRPTLSGERIDAADADEPSGTPTPEPVALPEDAMLDAAQVRRYVPGRGWSVTMTDDNTAGDGLVMPCQAERYADPNGTAALVRDFEPVSRKSPAPVTVTQTSQASATPKAAARSYDTMVGWFAGCTDDRAQLLETHAVRGTGDEAMLFTLRLWDEPTSTIVVGVARTGQFTTTTLTRTSGAGTARTGPSAELLGSAVTSLCALPEAGRCTTRPVAREVPPVPVAVVPAMLAEVDLPPVTGVDRPWVGTEPRQAKSNAAATGCDDSDFSRMAHDATRTFLIPKAKLPDQFGLTETVGALPEAKAKAFVAGVRAKLATCSDKQVGTEVERMRHVVGKRVDLTVWRVRTEVTDNLSVLFWMGIVRNGTSLAQVGFVPDPDVVMAPGAFDALVERALARLDAMPPPRSG